jgi:hypothetical protein
MPQDAELRKLRREFEDPEFRGSFKEHPHDAMERKGIRGREIDSDLIETLREMTDGEYDVVTKYRDALRNAHAGHDVTADWV